MFLNGTERVANVMQFNMKMYSSYSPPIALTVNQNQNQNQQLGFLFACCVS